MAHRRREDELIDFHNLPALPEGLLDLARPQDIRLKGPATRAATLLPQDTHYEVVQHVCSIRLQIGLRSLQLFDAHDSDG